MKRNLVLTREMFAISLMLTPVEEQSLDQALSQAQKLANQQDTQKIKVNGIIYTDSDNWTIWINGNVIKSGAQSQAQGMDMIRVVKVTSNSVKFIWTSKSNEEHKLCLKPHESYDVE